MSFNGQTVIFFFSPVNKRTQNCVHKPDNPHLNEPFLLVPCINLINHNLNEPLPTFPCKKLITHFSKTVRINKKKHKISRKMTAEATMALINQGKVFFVCVYKHRHSQTLHLWELHRLLESRFIGYLDLDLVGKPV